MNELCKFLELSTCTVYAIICVYTFRSYAGCLRRYFNKTRNEFICSTNPLFSVAFYVLGCCTQFQLCCPVHLYTLYTVILNAKFAQLNEINN